MGYGYVYGREKDDEGLFQGRSSTDMVDRRSRAVLGDEPKLNAEPAE
jgi:hypothetical protein